MEAMEINPEYLRRLDRRYPDILKHIVEFNPVISEEGHTYRCLSEATLQPAIFGKGDTMQDALEDWEKSFDKLLAYEKTKKLKTPFPGRIPAMLASSAKKPFVDLDWLYEIKWDGYRVTAQVQQGKATLYFKDGQDCTSQYKLIANELTDQPDMILDGEVVVLDENGKPDYNALQTYNGKGDLVYYIFDLLYLDGESYLNKQLLQRKEMLLHVLKKDSMLTYSDHFDDGIELFNHMKQLGLEGIVAKKKESVYQPGKRSRDWVNNCPMFIMTW